MAIQGAVSRLVDPLNPFTYDLNNPTPQSAFVSFFHAYPRFGRDRNLDFASPYILTIFLTAVPWLIVAFVCLLFGITVNVCYGGIRRRKLKRDAELVGGTSTSMRRSVSSSSCSDDYSVTIGRIAGGVLLFNFAILLLGVAFVANFHFKSGSLATVTIAEAATVDLSSDALSVFSVVETLLRRMLSSREPILQTIVSGARGSSFDPASGLRTMQMASRRFRAVAENIRELVGHVTLYGNIAFWLVAAVFALLFVGVMLLFSTAFEKRSSQKIAMSIYLVPFFVSWICVAIVTASSVLAGDMCVALGDFQKIVLVQSEIQKPAILAGIDQARNLFIRNNIQCPNEVVRGIPVTALADGLGLILSPAIAATLFPFLYPGSSRAAQEELRKWLIPAVGSAVNCKLVTSLAAQLNYAFCMHNGPMLALFACWISLILLALTLTVAYCLTQFTKFEASRFLNPYVSCDDDDDSSGYESFSGIYDKASVDIEANPGSTEPAKALRTSPPVNHLPSPPPVKAPPVQTIPVGAPVFRMPGDPDPVAKEPVVHPVYPVAAPTRSEPKANVPTPPPPPPSARRSAPTKISAPPPPPPPGMRSAPAPAPPAPVEKKPSLVAKMANVSKAHVSKAPPPPPPPKPVGRSAGAPPPPPPPPPPPGPPSVVSRGAAPPPPPPPPPPVRR